MAPAGSGKKKHKVFIVEEKIEIKAAYWHMHQSRTLRRDEENIKHYELPMHKFCEPLSGPLVCERFNEKLGVPAYFNCKFCMAKYLKLRHGEL
ncbi:hypothetical protein PR048_017322 [Dryococelus australis]|uniref:Uncharacterized protein n=1 Tax=Dryococelus australis TaxID=614101 RepID=A0ABQ9H996_9NEOP|nr:hypothetical protein PR048_017322 [Dryococelus australis]